MSVLGKDDLIDTTGTTITAHAPSGTGAAGGPWAVISGGTAPVALMGGGFDGAAVVGYSLMTGASGNAPDYAQATINFASDQYAGVGLFTGTGVGSGGGVDYLFQRVQGSGAWKIVKDGGTAILGTYNGGQLTGHDYVVRLERTVSGGTATLTAYLDGVQVATGSDSSSAHVGTMYGGICPYQGGSNVTITLFESGGTAVGIPPTPDVAADAAGFVYAGRWGAEGAERHTITNGAACEFVCDAASVTLCFDHTQAATLPAVAAWVDGVGPTRAAVGAAGLVALTMPAAYATPAHTVHRVRFLARVYSEYPDTHDDWTDRRDALRFLGVQLTGGASTVGTSPPLPDTIECVGDSITAGLSALYTGSYGIDVDVPEAAWPQVAADLLGLRAVVTAHGGQGVTTTGTDGAPVAATAFPDCYAGKAYSPARDPVAVVCYMGTNDTSFTQGQYAALVAAVRAKYPAAYLFCITPAGKSGLAAAISAAVAAAGPRVYYLDYSALSYSTSDGLHPTVGGAVTLGTRVATDVRAQLELLGVRTQAGRPWSSQIVGG